MKIENFDKGVDILKIVRKSIEPTYVKLDDDEVSIIFEYSCLENDR